MRLQHAFRPRISEQLEPRAVPSTAGVPVPTGVLGLTVTLPSQVRADSPQVRAAFVAFDRSYVEAVDNVLLAPGAGGLVEPTSNRAAFDAAIEGSLEVLAGQLVQALGASGSPGSTARAQVLDAIVGPGPDSLESRLLAVPTTALGFASPTSTGSGVVTAQAPVASVMTSAEQVRPTVRVPVAQDATALTTSPDPSSTPASKASREVRSAFGNFLNDYFKAVQGVLLAPDSAGRVDPGARRADFDARVGRALATLDDHLATAAGHHPATSGLAPRIRAAVEGDASSLKAQLAGLPTPEGARAAAVRDFNLGSTRAIAQALALIGGDVSRMLGD